MFGTIAQYRRAARLESNPGVDQLVTAEERSNESIQSAREFVMDRMRGTEGVDVVAFGSLARREWTDQSDFDYLVVVHNLNSATELRSALLIADQARQRLEAGSPGASGMFGTIVSASELISRIGLETDTNQTLTRRLLMLEESVSLFDQTRHDGFIGNMLDRYLFEYHDRQKQGVPRFLINDVVRHWRTVSVDYQAKNWLRVSEEGWGLRWLKLRISRKLAFVGTIAPLLGLHVAGVEPEGRALLNLFHPPPLVRIASMYEHLDSDGRTALGQVLEIAGAFNLALNDAEFRSEAGNVANRASHGGERFQEMAGNADRLQTLLEQLFFSESSPYREAATRYLTF